MPYPKQTVDMYLAKCWRSESGCLIYPGRPSKKYADTKKGRLSRLVMERTLGRPLCAGEVVRHTCDTPRCVDWRHLQVGSQGDNNRDTVRRSRWVNGWGRTTVMVRREIAARYKFGGISQARLAREYGVTQCRVSQIIRECAT